MFGPSLLGQTLAWHPAPDPPGAWVYSVEDEIVAELRWSRSEGLVRAEIEDEVWRVRFAGVFPIRGILQDSAEGPRMVYAGSLWRGLAQMREGRGFVLFSQLDREHGPWVGFDDAEGEGVLRIRGRVGGGQLWSEVTVTPDSQYRSFLGPLLLMWGSLQLLRQRRPRLSILSSSVSERVAQRALERLASSVAF